MLNIFKKIRYNLMSTNKTGKYLKYAIGEIILVMIGILLALQVNTWNETRTKKASLNTYLKNLSETFKGDIKTMDKLETTNAFRFHSMQYLLEFSDQIPYNASLEKLISTPFEKTTFEKNNIWKKPIPENYDEEFIRLAFLWSGRLISQNINLSAIEELKNTGMFAYIENDNLKKSITEYYSFWNVRIGDGNQKKHHWIVEQWETSLGEEGLLPSGIASIENPLELLSKNKTRTYWLKRLIRESNWMMENASSLKERANKLILQIEADIK